MSLQPLVPAIVIALFASIAVMASAVTGGQSWAVHGAAAIFALVIAGASWRINRPYWREAAGGADTAELVHAGRRNTRLAALTYAWGAAALLLVYQLSGLSWYHSSQYGAGAAVIAAGLLAYVHRLGKPEHAAPPPVAATALHGAAVGGGLVFLVATGKIWSSRPDWVANAVFLWGGLALLAICTVAAAAQGRLMAGQAR
jgi:hypothetical protein